MMKSLSIMRSSIKQSSKSIFVVIMQIQLLIQEQKHKEQEVMLMK